MVIYKVIARTSGWSTWLRAKRLGVNDIQAPAASERLRLFLNTLPTNPAPQMSVFRNRPRTCPLGASFVSLKTNAVVPPETMMQHAMLRSCLLAQGRSSWQRKQFTPVVWSPRYT